jgi:hypothetical protein
MTPRGRQDPRSPQVSRAFMKMMQGEPLTQEEIEEADRLGYEEMKMREEENKRLAELNDPNKTKFMNPAEKRYEVSKIMARRPGGPVANIWAGLPRKQSGYQ